MQRTERFLPLRFRKPEQAEQPTTPTTLNISAAWSRLTASIAAGTVSALRKLVFPFRWLFGILTRINARLWGRSGGDDGQSLLGKVTATGYGKSLVGRTTEFRG